MSKYIAILLVIAILLAFTAKAQELEYNIYDFKVKYGSALVVNDMIFKGKANISTVINLAKDARGILLTINNENIEPEIIEHETNKLLKINRKNVERVRISYITQEIIDENEFLTNIKANFPTELLQVSLTLPQGATLDRPLVKAEKDSGSIYPKPDKVDIDEQSEIFIWERGNFKTGDELSIYVKFKQRASLLWLGIPLAMFFLVLIFYIYYLRQQTVRIKLKTKKK